MDMKKISFFFYYVLISISILILAFNNTRLLLNKLVILVIIIFLGIALKDHFYETKNLAEKEKIDNKIFNKENIKTLIGCSLAAMITWYINHEMGYGPIIASGLVGLIANLLFSPKQAGNCYIASFVGMSSQAIVSSLITAGVIGLFAAFIINSSQEIYKDIGGKGGTIATFSTQLVKIILSFFI